MSAIRTAYRAARSEAALAECQQRFADAQQFKDPSRAKTLQEEFDTLTVTLEQLESEYFMREE
jgi:hypothetical protein